MIQRLREEIEQMDVNLIRFNVKKECEEFIKKIRFFSDEKDAPMDEDDDSGRCFFCCIKVRVSKFNLKIFTSKKFTFIIKKFLHVLHLR